MAILVCDYELDGEVLYAVKWYKDDEEFYRFVPKSNPPQHSYKVDGIKVDVSTTNGKSGGSGSRSRQTPRAHLNLTISVPVTNPEFRNYLYARITLESFPLPIGVEVTGR